MDEVSRLTPQDVLDAFACAWGQLTEHEIERNRIAADFELDTSWSEFVFGQRESSPSADSRSLFPLTAFFINEARSDRPIKQLRYEDYKIDMLMVGGEPCFRDNWGYASRQLVAIEHENQASKVEEEFYKLMLLRADVRVVAFPNWSKSYIHDRRSRNSHKDPAEAALVRLTALANKFGQNSLDGFLILISQCERPGDLPNWTYVIPEKNEVGIPTPLPERVSG